MKTQKTVSTEPGSENTVDPEKLRELVKSDLKVAASLCHLVQTNNSVASAVVVALEIKEHDYVPDESVKKDAQLACALLCIIMETPAIFDHVVEGMVGLHNNALAAQELKKQAAEELLN